VEGGTGEGKTLWCGLTVASKPCQRLAGREPLLRQIAVHGVRPGGESITSAPVPSLGLVFGFTSPGLMRV